MLRRAVGLVPICWDRYPAESCSVDMLGSVPSSRAESRGGIGTHLIGLAPNSREASCSGIGTHLLRSTVLAQRSAIVTAAKRRAAICDELAF